MVSPLAFGAMMPRGQGLSGLSGLNAQAGGGGLAGMMGGLNASAFGSIGGGAPGLDAVSLHNMGVSNSSLMLMAQINMMMASVLGGIGVMMQQIMAKTQQRQLAGGNATASGASPSFAGSAPGTNTAPAGTADAASAAPVTGGTADLHGLPEGVRRWEPQIQAAAKKYGVPPAMIAAVMTAESGGNPNAGSPAGAQGLMQFMPGTFSSVAQKHGISGGILDPEASINAGAAHLADLYKTYGDWTKVLAAYNAGPGNVDRWQSIGETSKYVPKVLGYFRQYGGQG